MAETAPLNVTLYGRAGCPLCDEVRDHLMELRREIPHRLAEADIDADPVLQKKYFGQIPVVEIGPYTLQAPITRQDLAMTLGVARDRREQGNRSSSWNPSWSTAAAAPGVVDSGSPGARHLLGCAGSVPRWGGIGARSHLADEIRLMAIVSATSLRSRIQGRNERTK